MNSAFLNRTQAGRRVGAAFHADNAAYPEALAQGAGLTRKFRGFAGMNCLNVRSHTTGRGCPGVWPDPDELSGAE